MQILRSLPIALALAGGAWGAALAQGAKPANASAQCGDGSYSTAATKRGACSAHGGVKTWYADAAASPAPAATASAAPPKMAMAAAAAPANATAKCKDGSWSTAATKRGACSGHGGIGQWLAADGAAATASAAPAKPSMAAATTSAPASAPMTRAAPAQAAAPAQTMAAPAPANAPADATAQCKDGTFSKAQHHRGACSGHKGVGQWLKNVPA